MTEKPSISRRIVRIASQALAFFPFVNPSLQTSTHISCLHHFQVEPYLLSLQGIYQGPHLSERNRLLPVPTRTVLRLTKATQQGNAGFKWKGITLCANCNVWASNTNVKSMYVVQHYNFYVLRTCGIVTVRFKIHSAVLHLLDFKSKATISKSQYGGTL